MPVIGVRPHTRRASAWIRCAAAWLRSAVLLLMVPGMVLAQDAESDLMQRAPDGEGYQVVSWPEPVARPGEHARWREQLVRWYQADGWFSAVVDSVSATAVWVSTGHRVTVSNVELGGAEPDGLPDSVRRELEEIVGELKGAPASTGNLESTIGMALEVLARAGYLAATLSVDRMHVESDGMVVGLWLESGPQTRLSGIRLEGDERTRPSLVYSLLGLEPGDGLQGLDRSAVRARLLAAGWHERVDVPRFELLGDSVATMIIPVVPRSPGQFDVMVGSLTGAEGERNRWVGSGHLLLTNAFGAGRTLEARVNRLPDQAASVRLAFDTPAPGGWPVQLSGQFEGYQQDSTFNRTSFGGGAMVRIDPNTGLGGTIGFERTRAGQAGGVFVGDAVRIPESTSRFAGLRFRYSGLDSGIRPRSGLRVETRLERGRRTVESRERVGGDTLRVTRSEPRERLHLDVEMFGPNRGSFGLATGIRVDVLGARKVDESELLFLGGASSLRGYDEDRFRGTRVGRAFIEGRWYVDRQSHGFVFYDAGWVGLGDDQSGSLPESLREGTGYHPGYGLGFVFSSAAGPISLSYALNPEETARNGRVHIALSFGL